MNKKEQNDGRGLDEVDAKQIKLEDLAEAALDQEEQMLMDCAIEREREAKAWDEFCMDQTGPYEKQAK